MDAVPGIDHPGDRCQELRGIRHIEVKSIVDNRCRRCECSVLIPAIYNTKKISRGDELVLYR